MIRDPRSTFRRRISLRPFLGAMALVLLVSGCAQKPVRPIPLDQADTSAWFANTTGYRLDGWYDTIYNEGRADYRKGNYEEAVEQYRALAKEGAAEGAYELGKAYRYGKGVPRDKEMAAQWLIAAVSVSHSHFPHASYHLGTMFLEGEGVPRKPGLARRLLEQAHENGYARAALPLARIYAEGLGVDKDPGRAERLAQASAETGDIESYLWLMRAYQPDGVLGENASETKALADKASNLLKKRIREENDSRAMRDLAMIHYEGLGRPRDTKTALDWLNRAARAGRPDYLVRLGEDMLKGTDGRKADPDQGFAILESAARRYQSPEAMALVAEAYRDGVGTKVDSAMSEKWFGRAAKAGSAKAQLDYGRMLVARENDPESVRRGVTLLEQAARSDMPYAWAELGELHVERAFPGAMPSKGVTYLERAHNAGIASATLDLGRAYLSGTGVQPDVEKAETLLKKAAADGQSGAMIELGRGYLDGKALPRRPQAAGYWLEKAARNDVSGARLALGRALLSGEIPGEPRKGQDIVTSYAIKGDPLAMMELGRAMRDGHVIAENHDAARYWFEKAMAAGEPDAKSTLASMLFDDANTDPIDIGRMTEAAELGHDGAMSVLGRAYLEGQGAEQSPPQAMAWLHRAIEAGNMTAAATLGSAYLGGRYGLDHRPEKGRELLERAIAAGDATAERELGYAFLHPKESGLRPAPGRGIELLRLAARKSDIYAMELLGTAYLEGAEGVRPQPDKAKIWLERAAEAGDVSSMTTLGVAYVDGKPLKRDVDTGLRYLERAAAKGDDTARAELGRLYVNGVPGIPRQSEKGLDLLRAAAENGHAGAMATLGRIYVNGDAGEKRLDEGARLLFQAARAGHTTARFALAKAFLQSQGLEKANQDYAQAWLQSIVAGHTEVAVRTLTEMLREGDVRIPEFQREQSKKHEEIQNEKS